MSSESDTPTSMTLSTRPTQVHRRSARGQDSCPLGGRRRSLDRREHFGETDETVRRKVATVHTQRLLEGLDQPFASARVLFIFQLVRAQTVTADLQWGRGGSEKASQRVHQDREGIRAGVRSSQAFLA